jgi:AraC-like DNA-binding protein
MVYVERRPDAALAPYIRALWYTYDLAPVHARERVLPAGYLQIVMSLAQDYLTDCNNDCFTPAWPSAPALLVGIHSRCQVIDRFDMAELIGVVFRPGGTTPFFPMETHVFSHRETSLEDIWGRQATVLRDRMREARTMDAKFAVLEQHLLCRLGRAGAVQRPAAVDLALAELKSGVEPISAISRRIGLSSRRLSEVFRAHVGVSPKLYHRILRFQSAVKQIHAGCDVRWPELALACGYYDQSHFANDFREFSGISPTTYTATPRMWSNHVPLE